METDAAAADASNISLRTVFEARHGNRDCRGPPFWWAFSLLVCSLLVIFCMMEQANKLTSKRANGTDLGRF